MTHPRSLVFVGSLIALAACNNPPPNPQPDGAGGDAAVTPDAMDNDGHVDMDGSMTGDAEADASTPPEDGARSEDWGFRPRPNGFAFENYTNMDMPTNLTPVEMRRVFGPQVCEGGAAMGACTLVPQAAQWMQQQNAGMNGGHCEGMAVVASLMFSGALPVNMFGMGTNAGDLGLMGNDALQREIATWFVTQSTLPMLERRNLTPSQVIDELSRDLSRGRAFGGTVLGIYKRGGGGGHAITPYALRRPNAQTVEVLSYDNNYANVERVLTVNLATNTWSYNASTNPMEPSSMYEGDAMTFNLTLADIAPRTMFPHACTFCGDTAMDGGGMRAVQVSLRGAADLSISDGMGHTTGYDSSGNEVNTIPGATLQRSRSASLYTDSPEPTYTVPRATPLTITLDGTRLAGAEPSDVLVTGPGYSLGVEGVSLDPMQRDTIVVQPGAPDILYRTTGSETPTIVLAFQQAGADYTIELRSTAMTAGQVLHIQLDLAMQRARVSFDGSTSAPAFTLYMDRVSESGTVNFAHAGVSATSSSVLYVNFGSWGGNSMPLSLGVDTNGDGTIDRTDTLTDES
ncbi:MAG: hypothetical protein U0269_14065 [Polyangiales bacterium]